MYEGWGSSVNLFPSGDVQNQDLSFGYNILNATSSINYSGNAVAIVTMGTVFAGPDSIGLNPTFSLGANGIGQASIYLSEQVNFTIVNNSDNDYYGDSTRIFAAKFGFHNELTVPLRNYATWSMNIVISSEDVPGYNINYTRSDSCTPTNYDSIVCRQEEDFGLNQYSFSVAAHQTVNVLMSIEYAAEARVVSEPSPITVFMAGLAGLVGISTLRSRRVSRRNQAA